LQGFGIRVGPERGRVIYDGIEVPAEQVALPHLRHEVLQEFGIPLSSTVVTMVARLGAAKDHPTLARAAARVAATFPDVHFLIVGAFPSPEAEDRTYFAELKTLIESLGLIARFTFTGYRSDTSRLVAASDIIVLCTHAEGLPLVVLEAMAQAKPVIATAVDGIPEVIKDGETGLLHAHEDAEQLGDRLLFLLKDPEGAVRLGKAGQQFCRKHFSQAQFAGAMAAYYRDTLEACSSRRLLAERLRRGWRGR
jgi:glycosyltransferase involved in cell wall biosynthesis